MTLFFMYGRLGNDWKHIWIYGYMNIWMYIIYNISGVKCISVVLELVRDIHVLKHVKAYVLS